MFFVGYTTSARKASEAKEIAASTASLLSRGCSSSICSIFSPAASFSSIDSTVMRVPTTTGLPISTAGSDWMRSFWAIAFPRSFVIYHPIVLLLAPSGGMPAYILQPQTWVTTFTTGVTFLTMLGVYAAIMRIQSREGLAQKAPLPCDLLVCVFSKPHHLVPPSEFLCKASREQEKHQTVEG